MNVPPARTGVCTNTTGRSGSSMNLAVRMPQLSNGGASPPRSQVSSEPPTGSRSRSRGARREHGQQPYAVGGASDRTEHCVQALCLRRAGQHRGLEYEETDQHENDGARDAAQRAQRPREQGQRPGRSVPPRSQQPTTTTSNRKASPPPEVCGVLASVEATLVTAHQQSTCRVALRAGRWQRPDDLQKLPVIETGQYLSHFAVSAEPASGAATASKVNPTTSRPPRSSRRGDR
jgi:hypothetical protein